VEAAGGDVGAAAELAAGVQLGGDHLDTGQPGLGLLVRRDAATVVVDLGGAVGVEGHLDGVGGVGQRLVDAVVDDLPQALHQPAGVGGADVHSRPLAHRLEALEDEEVGGGVGVVGDRRAPAVERLSWRFWLRRPTYPRVPTRRRCHACPTRRKPVSARRPDGARHAGAAYGVLQHPRRTPGLRLCHRHDGERHHEVGTIRERMRPFRPGIANRKADSVAGGNTHPRMVVPTHEKRTDERTPRAWVKVFCATCELGTWKECWSHSLR
jgi:hypothetical protein